MFLFNFKGDVCKLSTIPNAVSPESLQMIRKQRSSLDIDESLNEMRQDEPRLIEILRKHYLYPPSELPYNFSNPYPDLKGQVLQALFIYEDFFKGKNVRTTTKLSVTNI